MTFGEAIQALKNGKHVARRGWNGKGMFLFYVPGASYAYEELNGYARDAARRATLIEKGEQGSSRWVCAHICMKNASGQLVIGWLASQEDMLCDDWEVLNG